MGRAVFLRAQTGRGDRGTIQAWKPAGEQSHHRGRRVYREWEGRGLSLKCGAESPSCARLG